MSGSTLKSKITSIFSAALKPVEAAAVQRNADSTVTVTCTLNNIHVVVSNIDGQIVSKVSGGMVGEPRNKHRMRSSSIAAAQIGKAAARKAAEAGHRMCHVHVKGPSRGRGQVLRGITMGGLRIVDRRDVTPLPTNGCRPRHSRRLFSSISGGSAEGLGEDPNGLAEGFGRELK